jgi:HAD superfamily hydrolase (TIGR01458 family)
VFLLSTGDLADDLTGIDIVGVDDDADVVVLGGAGLAYTHEQLNRAFNLLLEGASFVAMHRNLTWRTARGMELDTGAYVIALEAATGVQSTVIGKPSPAFFDAGLDALRDETGSELQPYDVMMIGDDVVNDVGGAQAVGMRGCLVRTGKFSAASLAAAAVEPDDVVDDLAAAVAQLDSDSY